MRYMLLICSDDKNAPPAPRAEMEAIIQGHRRFSDELQAAGKMVVGERLRPDGDASRIRLKAGQRQVMDGPFTQTKEAPRADGAPGPAAVSFPATTGRPTTPSSR